MYYKLMILRYNLLCQFAGWALIEIDRSFPVVKDELLQ